MSTLHPLVVVLRLSRWKLREHTQDLTCHLSLSQREGMREEAKSGAGEMAWQLGALAAFIED